MEQVYFVITTVETKQVELNADGNPVETTIAPGTIVNTVLWDGASAWTPGEGLRAVSVAEYVPPTE